MAKVGDNVCFITRTTNAVKNDFGDTIITHKLVLANGEIIEKIINKTETEKLVNYKIKSKIPGDYIFHYREDIIENYFTFKTKDKLIKKVNDAIYNALNDKNIKVYKESLDFPVLIENKSYDFDLLFYKLRELKKDKR